MIFDIMAWVVAFTGFAWALLTFAGVVYFLGLLVQRIQDRRLARIARSEMGTIEYATNSIYIAASLFIGQFFFLVPGIIFLVFSPAADPAGDLDRDVLIRSFTNIVFITIGEAMHVVTGMYFQRQRKRLVKEEADNPMLVDLWFEVRYQTRRLFRRGK